MSDEEVGPIIWMPFMVATEGGFPHGLICPTCDRRIEPGQPYTSHRREIYDNGDTMTVLTCVYCAPTAGE